MGDHSSGHPEPAHYKLLRVSVLCCVYQKPEGGIFSPSGETLYVRVPKECGVADWNIQRAGSRR